MPDQSVPTLREQLARKRGHHATIRFPLGDDGERLKGEIDKWERALEIATLSGSVDAKKTAQNELNKARRKYERPECSFEIRVRGLGDEERDTLMSAHPPTPEQVAEDDKSIKAGEMQANERRSINRTPWLAAALEIVQVVDDDGQRLSAAEWEKQLRDPAHWTAGEVVALYATVLAASHDAPSPGIPLG